MKLEGQRIASLYYLHIMDMNVFVEKVDVEKSESLAVQTIHSANITCMPLSFLCKAVKQFLTANKLLVCYLLSLEFLALRQTVNF